jgi:hypothetical protein
MLSRDGTETRDHVRAPAKRPTLTRRAAAAGVAGALLAAVCPSGAPAKSGVAARTFPTSPWWKNAVAYEMYPRSFQDTNGDGIGDFRGMTERLAYLADLGIDAIWVAACFDSPNADNGYDVRDYRTIQPEFGSMVDFDAFLARAKQHDIRVILDMVFNHSSDDRWFTQSRRSRDNPYREYSIWRDGKDGKPPTNWPSVLGGSAWEFDAHTNAVFAGTSIYSVAEGWGATRQGIIDITDDRHAQMSSAFRMDFQLLDLDDWKNCRGGSTHCGRSPGG